MKAEKRKLKTAQAQADSAWIHRSFTVFVLRHYQNMLFVPWLVLRYMSIATF